jgi:hypothetical protein
MILKKCEGVVATIKLGLRLHTTLVLRVLDISRLLIDPTVEMSGVGHQEMALPYNIYRMTYINNKYAFWPISGNGTVLTLKLTNFKINI